MQWLCSMTIAALMLAAMPFGALADDQKQPEQKSKRPTLFDRLDKNQDGVIEAGEVPAGAPEAMKAFLTKADANHDQKLTQEELLAAKKDRPKFDQARKGQGRGKVHARPHRHRPNHQGKAHRGAQAGFNPRAIFARLDRNDDGQLSEAEFAAGMKAMQMGMQKMAKAREHAYGRKAEFAEHRPPHYGRGVHRGPPIDLARQVEAATRMFARADRNRDGKISLREVPVERRERFERLLGRVDKNGDMAIDKAEARRMAVMMAKYHKPARAEQDRRWEERPELARDRWGRGPMDREAVMANFARYRAERGGDWPRPRPRWDDHDE